MITKAHFLSAALLASALVPVSSAEAQNSNLRRMQQQQRQMQRRMEQQRQEAAENQPLLPRDPELLSLHKEFITRAEKLAAEYERKKQYDRAREVFEAMARLVPKFPVAEAGVSRMLQMQKMSDRRLTEVSATGGWQDSGAKLAKGMPVRIDVDGTWRIVLETGPEGVEIPEEMKFRDPRIKLGSLIAAIAASPGELEKAKPFVVRSGSDFVADQSGTLYLRVYDVDPSDNQGQLRVMIQSTFAD